MRTLRLIPALLLFSCAEMGTRSHSPTSPFVAAESGGAPRAKRARAEAVSEADRPAAVEERRADGVAYPSGPAAAPDREVARPPKSPARRPEPAYEPPESVAGAKKDVAAGAWGPSTDDGVALDPTKAPPVLESDLEPDLDLIRPPPPPMPRARPGSPGVKAGAADDNLAFGAYLRFLADNQHLIPFGLDVSRRVVVQVRDRDGRPLHDARVALEDRDGVFDTRRTYADGRALLFPSEQARSSQQGVKVKVSYGGATTSAFVNAAARHTLDLRLDVTRAVAKRVPLDIAFVLDTTGSMGDELARLKQTLEVINFQVSHLEPAPDVRFGMVLYRDVGDDYRVRSIPFTRDVQSFARQLEAVQAGGGNDYPEDVQEGLRVAMQELKWRETGVRLAFLIGDAPPHTDYDQAYTYVSAMKEAARRGIKIATIGASGLTREGEVVWRQIAQYTMSPFVFLSYGEKGDSEGSASSVSHHVGSNWVAENLDAIIIRMVKVEMAHLTPRGAPTRQDYFTASRDMRIPADDVLEDLFSQSVRQLLDYSVERIAPRTPTVVLPLSSKPDGLQLAKLERRLQVGLARTPAFQLIERKGMPSLLDTLAQQLGERYDEAQVAEVGRLVPAKLAVLGHVEPSKSGPYEMLVKLVRLETGEVLSLSLLKIDRALLL